MRKAVAATRVFVASLVLVSTVMIAETEARISTRVLSLQDLASSLNTPDAVAHYLWRNFRYEYDQRQFGTEEHWQSPQEFLKTRSGDCEDFALFAHEMLRRNGITSYLLNVYGPRYAHTVTIFREHGRFHVIDGNKVKRYGAGSLEELSSKLYPYWEKSLLILPSAGSSKPRVIKSLSK